MSRKIIRRCPRCGKPVEVAHVLGRTMWKNHKDDKGQWCYPNSR